VTITDEIGSVEVPVNPERVVVLDYGALENLDLVGANVVGIPKTGLPDYLSKYEDDSIEDLGNLIEVSMEKINNLQPDRSMRGGGPEDSYEEWSKIAPTIMPPPIVDRQINALEQNTAAFDKIVPRHPALD